MIGIALHHIFQILTGNKSFPMSISSRSTVSGAAELLLDCLPMRLIENDVSKEELEEYSEKLRIAQEIIEEKRNEIGQEAAPLIPMAPMAPQLSV